MSSKYLSLKIYLSLERRDEIFDVVVIMYGIKLIVIIHGSKNIVVRTFMDSTMSQK
jgi:hypothetical protein